MHYAYSTPILFLILAFISACTTTPDLNNSKSIKHGQSTIRVGIADALVGSKFTEEQKTAVKQNHYCTARPDSLHIDGLAPNAPLGFCFEQGQQIPEQALRGNSGVPTVGQASWLNLSILKEGEVKIIRTFTELKETYAPVETPEEALSFVLLKYNLTERLTAKNISKGLSSHTPSGLGVTFSTDFVEGTKMQKNDDGSFSILNILFDGTCRGGLTQAYSVNYLVFTTGEIKETAREAIYETSCPIS